MLGEVLLLNQELKELRDETTMRIGITQDMIDTHLTQGREALNQYIHAANAHFNAKKGELADIAQNELKNALIDAHRQMAVLNPPKAGLNTLLTCALISAFTGAFIGITGALLFLHFA
ncbi:hypothetical protein VII00023_20527 [Vibrio ichthyoenteri ATCC 700023]|uniref:Uncharacterized protein n=2 Tax=Vibrio ichthyoenteri TaxID=142461 RepID=F9S7R8_9VIBR|nr:hypothetical protein VII00023_20527 [Vibrio ichthyoenteri ATCC 700023]